MYQEERICKNCGKTIYVLHPSRWAYKRRKGSEGYDYYCTWKCFREEEKGKTSMKCKITPDKRAEAIRIALDGGDVVEFLRKNGSVTPDKLWWYIKNQLKQKEPETYAKLPQQKKTEPKKAQPKKKQAEKKPLAEVAKKLPRTEAVAMTREEHKEAHRTNTTLTIDERGLRIEQIQETEMEVVAIKSQAVPGQCFVKSAEQREDEVEQIMSLESLRSVFNLGVILRMNRAGWLTFIEEIKQAMDQMKI